MSCAIITGYTSNFKIGDITSVQINKLCNKINIPFFKYNFDKFKSLRIQPSWHKLYAVIDSLTQFKTVMWIDADIVPVSSFINNDLDLLQFKYDLAEFGDSDYYQAMVCFCSKGSLSPNMGLFMAKKEMIEYYIKYLYELAIDGTRKSDATKWFEQEYAVKYMGFKKFSSHPPLRGRRALQVKQPPPNTIVGWRLATETELFKKTMWLPAHYNTFDYESAMHLRLQYEDLSEAEKNIFKKSGKIPLNGGASSGQPEWFYHSFSPLREERMPRILKRI